MVRAGSSSSSGGGGGEAGGGDGEGGAGPAGAGWCGRSRTRSRRRRLSANCPDADKMSPSTKKVECFSPMLCHCKVACTNSTISLMFGCKVGSRGWDAEFSQFSHKVTNRTLSCFRVEHTDRTEVYIKSTASNLKLLLLE